jgi:FMN phosphatase YigB (HAD superfamily)
MATAARRGLRNPLNPSGCIRAVLFDLDGTLYRQSRMRRLMAIELAGLVAGHPFTAAKRLKALSEYRRAQETLRHGSAGDANAGTQQIAMAAERSGLPVTVVEALVTEWMHERPLKHMTRCLAEGSVALLDALAGQGVPAAVFSDYPTGAKIEALGLGGRFAFELCAADADIGAFKPNPRGFLVACRRWGLPPGDVLMVGDRADVDGAGAAAAGMPCVIIRSTPATDLEAGLMVLPSLERLRRVFFDERSGTDQ